MDTKKETIDTRSYLSLEGGMSFINKELSTMYYAYHLGDKIIYAQNPPDSQFSYITTCTYMLKPKINA